MPRSRKKDETPEVVHTTVSVTAQCADGCETVVKVETPNADNKFVYLSTGESATVEVPHNAKLVVSERDKPSTTSYTPQPAPKAKK